ncbi:SMI1/KNR4 family protein [Paenibacillus albidus]|uniref:SMI1/KNR4 family protein n=1 Tax=Paenibacillus albidus TaxID=2041023 RepID=UPI002034AB8B|nr:SMI1/KNR4 family protein [Paenibacillus albidus]
MYEQLAGKLDNATALKWYPGHGAQEEWMAQAEAELGFSLPPSYRWWLKNYF